jgi:hypothetical protein
MATATAHRTLPARGWFAAMRRARWFKSVLLLAVICTIGIYSVEVTHNHETPAQELHCPICQVVVHNSLQVYSPQFAPHPPIPRIQYLALEPQPAIESGREWTVQFQSRAPPIV